MIIVVALTGITGLLVPKMNASIIFIRFGLLFISSMFGFFGFVTGIAFVVIHVINLRSFGVPQLLLTGNLQYQEIKDTAFRAPWWQMRERSRMPSWNKTRMRKDDSND
jgi:spore germination protein KA